MCTEDIFDLAISYTDKRYGIAFKSQIRDISHILYTLTRSVSISSKKMDTREQLFFVSLNSRGKLEKVFLCQYGIEIIEIIIVYKLIYAVNVPVPMNFRFFELKKYHYFIRGLGNATINS